MALRIDAVRGAAGSSFVEVGGTKLACAVYGPRPPRVANKSEGGMLGVEVSVAQFAFPPRPGSASSANQKDAARLSTAVSTALMQTFSSLILLDKYPKSSIDVYVTVLSADGGEVAAALTAVSLALAHAQVEMHTLVAGAALWAAPDGLRVDALQRRAGL